ncbi:MAG: response regulator [Kofleriaceae bacterium]|nr:response regulator [Kofleriaceae bacterium]MBP9171976.1 response regulator [Kofleriaceae bacterium]MBP9860506.1 response regulator [Kofleriaceae bacterium]
MAEPDLDADFAPEELAMLRQLFRDEAQVALEELTARAGSASAGAADGVLEMMRVTHTLKGAAGTVGLSEVVDLTHRLEGALAIVRNGQRPWTPAFADAVVEIADGLRAHVDAWAEPAVAVELAKRVRELIAPWEGAPRTWRAGRDDADATRVGDTQGIPTEESDTGTSSVAVDVSGAHDARTLLRVEPERIDELMAAAGELLFDRNRIERRVQLLRTLTRELGRARQALRDAVGGELAAHHPLASIEGQVATLSTQLAQTSAALLDETEAMRRTLGDLQRGLTRVRMQTARALFAQLARALRAAARAAGVKVELRTRGEDTEFDKAVAEKITDPLIQLLRNAVAHGIEPATERVLGGKAAVGAIAIAARAEGNLVVIEVADDGRGVDAGRLRTRLVEAGRWSAARAALASDDEVVAALFDPGVSSKDEADELAGRGVGLDLVREAIARLGGEIRMASAPGRGTTFTLRLPVSTAVTHAMLFKVHGQVYALPNAQVIDTLVVEADAATHPVGGEPVAVLDLGQLLATPGHHPEASGRRPAVVVAYADKRVVCTVDKIVGPREIVVKQLGPLLSPLPLYAGATISGSGKVQLILDPAALIRTAYPGHTLADSAATAPIRTTLAGRALVVDDSRAIREALMSMLAREGWIVDTAEDGARAWALAAEVHYDLVVTDLEMPRMGGLELIGRLRGERRTAQIPIVVVSSRVNPEHRRRARELGVRGIVAKPITRRKLLEVLAADGRGGA